MNIPAEDVIASIDSSSECYYEVSIWEEVCIGYYIHGKRDSYEDSSGNDIHPYKLCLSLRELRKECVV